MCKNQPVGRIDYQEVLDPGQESQNLAISGLFSVRTCSYKYCSEVFPVCFSALQRFHPTPEHRLSSRSPNVQPRDQRVAHALEESQPAEKMKDKIRPKFITH